MAQCPYQPATTLARAPPLFAHATPLRTPLPPPSQCIPLAWLCVRETALWLRLGPLGITDVVLAVYVPPLARRTLNARARLGGIDSWRCNATATAGAVRAKARTRASALAVWRRHMPRSWRRRRARDMPPARMPNICELRCARGRLQPFREKDLLRARREPQVAETLRPGFAPEASPCGIGSPARACHIDNVPRARLCRPCASPQRRNRVARSTCVASAKPNCIASTEASPTPHPYCIPRM